MKNMKKIGSFLLILLLICGLLTTGVFAASVTTGISGITRATVGQSFTVNVIFRGNGVNIGSLDAAITYDTSKLTCTSISSSAVTSDTGGRVVVSYFNIDGASSLQVSLTFTAKAAGTASVQASVSGCTDQDLNPIGSYSGASANVTVSTPVSSSVQSSRPSTPQSSRPSSSRPSSSQSSSSSSVVDEPQVTPITVTVDGKSLQVVTSLIGIEVPEGFEAGQDEYRGQTVDVARSTEQDILLMYLTDADGNGGFYRFNRAADTFYPFLRITVNAARYTATERPETVKVPTGWTATTVTFGDQDIPAYQSDDPAYEGFYLVYAANGQGEVNFYLFDIEDGTMQRYVQSEGYAPITNPDGPISADPKGNFFERLLSDRPIFVTMCVAWALVVLIAGAWLVFHFARVHAKVSDKQRKTKEEKITKKLEKRAARAAKKNKVAQQKPEIGSLDEETTEPTEESETPEQPEESETPEQPEELETPEQPEESEESEESEETQE